MGSCCSRLQEMGVFGDGYERHGLVLGNRLISYHRVETALLEYPNVMEAGILAHDFGEGQQVMDVFLSLEQGIDDESELERFKNDVTKYVQETFDLDLPVNVRVYPKLPITRTGKIMRTVLAKWLEEDSQSAVAQ